MDTVKATLYITCGNEELDKEIEFYNGLLSPNNEYEIRKKALQHLRYFINDPGYQSCPQKPSIVGIVFVRNIYDSKPEDRYRLGSYSYHNQKISWYPEKRVKKTA
jgi:hypothetical protein